MSPITTTKAPASTQPTAKGRLEMQVNVQLYDALQEFLEVAPLGDRRFLLDVLHTWKSRHHREELGIIASFEDSTERPSAAAPYLPSQVEDAIRLAVHALLPLSPRVQATAADAIAGCDPHLLATALRGCLPEAERAELRELAYAAAETTARTQAIRARRREVDGAQVEELVQQAIGAPPAAVTDPPRGVGEH